MDDNTVGMEVDPDLAAAMGFSSFGPAKKSGKPVRAEAVVEAGTGTNRVQLGPRKRQANSDQDLVPRKRRADHDDVESVGSKATNTPGAPTESKDAETVTAQSDMVSATPPQGQGGPSHSEERMAVQSSLSAEKPKKNKETVPTGLAAFLARGKELPEKPSTGPSNIVPDLTGADVPTTSLPETSDTQPASTFVEPDLQALRNGIRDKNGDIAYFLPSFIEDPWTRLERQGS
ncbi:uncharacterized protein J3D65DRAFT_68111 [Phyllosticta citribraziliensis]|uniref:Uncharacterized protein n=1 Tax=Phyllosticta citribraziliensis TaxID=989973 RepID=A0ABR1LCT0_9PEZI